MEAGVQNILWQCHCEKLNGRLFKEEIIQPRSVEKTWHWMNTERFNITCC